MPHLHVRTSANLVENVDISEILEALTSELCRQSTIEALSVKTYHTIHANWTMGGDGPGFAHVTLSLVTGRDDAWLQNVGQTLFQLTRELFSRSIELDGIRPTFELRQMPKELYWK